MAKKPGRKPAAKTNHKTETATAGKNSGDPPRRSSGT